jgi:hypothetical protein
VAFEWRPYRGVAEGRRHRQDDRTALDEQLTALVFTRRPAGFIPAGRLKAEAPAFADLTASGRHA